MMLRWAPTLCSLVVVSTAAAQPQTPTEPGWFCASRDALLDYQLDRNGVRVNNFSVRERPGIFRSDMTVIEFSFSATNKRRESVPLDAQLVGLTGAGKVVFALKAGPMMDQVSDQKTEEAHGTVYATRGDLTKASLLCLRIIGAF